MKQALDRRLLSLERRVSVLPALPPPPPPWEPDDAFCCEVLRTIYVLGGKSWLCAIFCPSACTGDGQFCNRVEQALEEWASDA
jgi:hypothetical protein